MRIALNDKQVKLDTYILPLVANSRYNELRRVTGDGVVSLDLGSISPQTIAQFMMHLSPNVRDRGNLLGLVGVGGHRAALAGDLAHSSPGRWTRSASGCWCAPTTAPSTVSSPICSNAATKEETLMPSASPVWFPDAGDGRHGREKPADVRCRPGGGADQA